MRFSSGQYVGSGLGEAAEDQGPKTHPARVQTLLGQAVGNMVMVLRLVLGKPEGETGDQGSWVAEEGGAKKAGWGWGGECGLAR